MEKTLVPQRKDESGKDAIIRLLKDVSIPSPTHRALVTLGNSFELAKGQLRGHIQESRKEIHQLNWRLDNVLGALYVCEKDINGLNEKLRLEQSAYEHMKVSQTKLEDHEIEIEKLKDELEKERAARSIDDNLLQLYNAGTQLIAKQKEQIENLKAEVMCEKDGNEQMKRLFALKVSEDDREKASLMEAVQRLEGRLASLTTESTDAEADLRRRLVESENQAKVALALVDKVKSKVLANGKANGHSNHSAAATSDAELLLKLCMMEQRCESYCSTMAEQQKTIERLTKEKSELANDLENRRVGEGHELGYGPVRYTR